jgi:putative ABC transport system permease protein
MSVWRQLTRGLRVLANRNQADQDIADEARHYLEQTAEALVKEGLSPEEARRTARLGLGNIQEQVRDYGWENLISTTAADVRYAFRRLRKNPGFTAVCAFTLALGIGASTAIFSVVNPILFESLPYPQAPRIMMIWDISDGSRADVTFHSFRELQARSRSFDALAVMELWTPTIAGGAHPERFEGQSVSAGYFRVLGVQPALGRDFKESEDRFKVPHVVILSDALWKRNFGANGAIIGSQVNLDGNLYTVIGVMPKGFENVLAPSAELWSPLRYDVGNVTDFTSQAWGHHLHMVGRLRSGIGPAQAKRELDTIGLHPLVEFPRPPFASLKSGLIVQPLQGEVTREVKPALLAVLGAVLLVLLIACVNVTNLLLARGLQRRGEFAMRVALGAARSRLLRQLLTESFLLAIVGGALGMVVAGVGVRALVALSPSGLPRVDAISMDGPVFAFAFGSSALIGLLVGLVPALRAFRSDLAAGIQESSRRTAGGHNFTRGALVVSEVALALVLLVGAGLLIRSLQHLFAIPPGFDSSRVISMWVQESGHRFDDDKSSRRFFAQALEAVRRVPGVRSAAFTSLLPLSREQLTTYGASLENGGAFHNVFRYVVTPGYFETMSIPLLRGRLLDQRDVAGAQPAALISESLAKAGFPGQDPIGKRLHVGPSDRPWFVVAGVVGDVKQTSLADVEPHAVYLTPEQSWFADQEMSLVVRTRDEGTGLASASKNAVWSIDKDQPIVRIATMDSLLAASESQRRFALIVFQAFALVALVLAATGIFGVLSGNVNERAREIGVRSALGASRGDIVRLVVRQAVTLGGLGVVIGLAGAAFATKALTTLLFGVSLLDPVTYCGVIALMLAVSALAAWLPAWRAARVDPSITLRAE